MRELMKRFEVEKARFSLTSRDVRLELPKPLDRLNIEGRVKEGEMTIYVYDLFPVYCILLLMSHHPGTRCENCSIPA